MGNLVISSNTTVNGVPTTIVNATAAYQNGQIVNQQLILSGATAFQSPVGFSAFTMTVSAPVRLICAQGSNSEFINQTVNQTVTIDDTVDSFSILNLQETQVILNMTFTVNAGSTPPQQSLVTSVNTLTGAVKIESGTPATIAITRNTGDNAVVVSTVPGSIVQTINGVAPDSNGAISIQGSAIPGLAVVATSGSYTDLHNQPTIPPAQVNSDWNATSGVSQILNKPMLANVATTGNYNDLQNTPTLAAVATTGNYNDLQNRPNFATVATTGNFNDLQNIPNYIRTVNGNSPDVNGNLALPLNLPTLVFEFGNSAQPNGGFGLDKGTYWQADANSAGWSAYNGLTFTPQPDGTFTVPPGLYLATICATVHSQNGAADTYQLPVQMAVASVDTTGYGFPGIYQDALQYIPPYPIQTVATDGRTLGTISISGRMSAPVMLGFSKVLGSVSSTPLFLQGYATWVKIG